MLKFKKIGRKNMEIIENCSVSADERDVIEFPAWYGEFGWEVASWAPYCRKKSAGYKRVIVTSFEGMGPLYADFATDFRCHGQTGRSLKYPKMYRPDGAYFKYGRAADCPVTFDVLIHARGISRKNSINYRRWERFVSLFSKEPWTKAVIGSKDDVRLSGLFDYRGIELQRLMDLISGARVVVGVSSGIMHLAAFCGTDMVVWGDRRTYFSETLESRYKITWNPFQIRVGWINADDFQPEPEAIIEKIKEILNTYKKGPRA